MANLVTSWRALSTQRAALREKSSKFRAFRRQRWQETEEALLQKLSGDMGIDLAKIAAELEKAAAADRERIQPELEKLKAEVKHAAIQQRRRIDQAIKTYAKRGVIDALHKMYPNQPNLRMKYALDWEGAHEPAGVPGIGTEYGLSDITFVQELDAAGHPLVAEGHDGYCRTIRAHSHACAGDRRFGDATARTTQTLIFRHDPPPSLEGIADTCGYSELWVPMTVTGSSYACRSDAVFVSQTLGTGGGGVAEIGLEIRVEQDTRHEPLVYPITDRLIYSDAHPGSVWLWQFLFGIMGGVLDDGPAPISVLINEPYRVPVFLRTDTHGGGEVRVIVTLTTSVRAEHRHAEAEIDLASPGFGVEIHEVCLHCAGCYGTFVPGE